MSLAELIIQIYFSNTWTFIISTFCSRNNLFAIFVFEREGGTICGHQIQKLMVISRALGEHLPIHTNIWPTANTKNNAMWRTIQVYPHERTYQ